MSNFPSPELKGWNLCIPMSHEMLSVISIPSRINIFPSLSAMFAGNKENSSLEDRKGNMSRRDQNKKCHAMRKECWKMGHTYSYVSRPNA